MLYYYYNLIYQQSIFESVKYGDLHFIKNIMNRIIKSYTPSFVTYIYACQCSIVKWKTLKLMSIYYEIAVERYEICQVTWNLCPHSEYCPFKNNVCPHMKNCFSVHFSNGNTQVWFFILRSLDQNSKEIKVIYVLKKKIKVALQRNLLGLSTSILMKLV